LEYLFVYGTLLSNARDSMGAMMRARLKRETTRVGNARVPGRLFDLDAYPGMLETNPRERVTVRGEVLRLQNEDATLRWLDLYEDVDPKDIMRGVYRRVPQLAMLDDGEALRCWAYILNAPPDAQRMIPTGCWLSYVDQSQA